MNRRRYLATIGGLAAAGTAGCLDRLRVSASLETTDSGVDVEEPPAVTLDDGAVTARGTVLYGSSDCGTVRLAHANYERSQDRLDLLVVAADDSRTFLSCHDDLVEAGYRLQATVRGRLRRVVVTEHHAFGAAYSTTVRE